MARLPRLHVARFALTAIWLFSSAAGWAQTPLDATQKVYYGAYTIPDFINQSNEAGKATLAPDQSVTPYSNVYGPTNPSTPAPWYGSHGGSGYQRPAQAMTTYRSPGWSPAAKIITGTATGAVAGGLIGLFTGLSTRSRPTVRTTTTTQSLYHPVQYASHCGQYGRTMTAGLTETQVITKTQRGKPISRGSAAARGYAWGVAYGAAAGLLGGLAYAYFTRDPVAVSSSTYP